MAHTDEFKKVLGDIKNQANEFNKPYTHNHARSLDEYELAKHFMDKIVALEEQSISECMETDLYESELNDIIQEYKLYLNMIRDLK